MASLKVIWAHWRQQIQVSSGQDRLTLFEIFFTGNSIAQNIAFDRIGWQAETEGNGRSVELAFGQRRHADLFGRILRGNDDKRFGQSKLDPSTVTCRSAHSFKKRGLAF